jgi:hypothetical protein
VEGGAVVNIHVLVGVYIILDLETSQRAVLVVQWARK